MSKATDKKLKKACEEGPLELVQKLIEQGADVNSQYDGNWTPLSIACAHNRNSEITKALIEAGADVNHKDGMPTLTLAVICNKNVEVIKLLVNAGADLLVKDSYGKTAMNYAKEQNRQEVVEILQKALPNTPSKSLEKDTAISVSSYIAEILFNQLKQMPVNTRTSLISLLRKIVGLSGNGDFIIKEHNVKSKKYVDVANGMMKKLQTLPEDVMFISQRAIYSKLKFPICSIDLLREIDVALCSKAWHEGFVLDKSGYREHYDDIYEMPFVIKEMERKPVLTPLESKIYNELEGGYFNAFYGPKPQKWNDWNVYELCFADNIQRICGDSTYILEKDGQLRWAYGNEGLEIWCMLNPDKTDEKDKHLNFWYQYGHSKP